MLNRWKMTMHALAVGQGWSTMKSSERSCCGSQQGWASVQLSSCSQYSARLELSADRYHCYQDSSPNSLVSPYTCCGAIEELRGSIWTSTSFVLVQIIGVSLHRLVPPLTKVDSDAATPLTSHVYKPVTQTPSIAMSSSNALSDDQVCQI